MSAHFSHARKRSRGLVSRREGFLFWMGAGIVLLGVLVAQFWVNTRPQKPTGQQFFATAPGVDTALMPSAQRDDFLRVLNSKQCPCSCNMSLARCRNQDVKCQRSLGMAKELAAQFRNAGTTP